MIIQHISLREIFRYGRLTSHRTRIFSYTSPIRKLCELSGIALSDIRWKKGKALHGYKELTEKL